MHNGHKTNDRTTWIPMLLTVLVCPHNFMNVVCIVINEYLIIFTNFVFFSLTFNIVKKNYIIGCAKFKEKHYILSCNAKHCNLDSIAYACLQAQCLWSYGMAFFVMRFVNFVLVTTSKVVISLFIPFVCKRVFGLLFKILTVLVFAK